jgi:hypothetical protein
MISTELLNILAIGGTTFGVLGTTLGAIPYFSKKSNGDVVLNKAQSVVNSADKILAVANDVLPNNPVVNVLEVIEKWAKIAAGNAEQLYHAKDISKDDRAKVAEGVVLNVLQELKINVDDKRKALIDATIKNAVNDLGHEPVTEAQKTVQLQQVQAQTAQLTQENAALKQQLATVQSAATVQQAQ